MMKNVFIFAALVAFVAAMPDTTSSDLPEETMLVDEAASYEEAAAFLQKSNSNACLDLATATEKEVKDNVKQQQDMLNKLPNGSQCNSRGQNLVNNAKSASRAADNKVTDAQNKVNSAGNANVNWGSRAFNSLQKGKCDTFFASANYRNAASRYNTATNNLNKAKGAAKEAKTQIALAQEQAASLVRQCQCNTATAHQKMLGDAKKRAESQNKAAWTKAAHLRCVIKGVSASKCSVPNMPTVTAPRLSGASLNACNNHVAMVINGNDKTFHYGSGYWTNKAIGTFGNGNKKSPAFLLPATKATMTFWNGKSVSFNMHGRSLYDNFRGGTRNINIDGGYGRWRSLGFSWQPHCNHQGFNLREPHNNNVRLGINFNNENDCRSTDASIGVGVSRFTGSRSAGGFCGCCSSGNGCHQRAGTVTISVNVKAGTMITPKPTKSPTKRPTKRPTKKPTKKPTNKPASGTYKFGTLGQVACPSGFSRIMDEATCKTAMKDLAGRAAASVGKSCWNGHPKGCFTHYGRNRSTRILVNNNGCGKSSGTTYGDSQSICKKGGGGGASGYKFGTLGQVACPSGFSRIYDEATCRTAMKSVTGKNVASVGKHCWQAHPRGCFTHYGRNRSTRILVNNNGCGKTSGTTYSDSQSICKGSGAGGYKFGTLGQVACPSGYSRIYDEATCRAAMTSLAGSVQSVGKHCWQAHPRGCFTHYQRNRSTRILVNNNGCGKTSGTTYSDSQSICKRL